MQSTTRQPLTVDALTIGDDVALLLGQHEFVGRYGGKYYMDRRWRCYLITDDGAQSIPLSLIDRVVLLRSASEAALAEDTCPVCACDFSGATCTITEGPPLHATEERMDWEAHLAQSRAAAAARVLPWRVALSCVAIALLFGIAAWLYWR